MGWGGGWGGGGGGATLIFWNVLTRADLCLFCFVFVVPPFSAYLVFGIDELLFCVCCSPFFCLFSVWNR